MKRTRFFMFSQSVVMLTVGLISTSSYAAKFSNQFSEFELPPNWRCSLEGAEWVCQSGDDARKKEAIIVLAAKLKGDQDSLDQYLEYLRKPKAFTSVSGKPLTSEPKYAKNNIINGQTWVDSLHTESEIPNFYTRYLATVKEDIGVLITYSVFKPKYQDYLKDFDNLVNTLKVFRKAGGINVAPAGSNLFAQAQNAAGAAGANLFGGMANPLGGAQDRKSKLNAAQNDFLFGLSEDEAMLYGAVGIGLLLVMFGRKKKKK